MPQSKLYPIIKLLETQGELIRIKEEIDPYLLASEIHRLAYKNQGPAIFFEKIKGTRFPALCNLFGSVKRTEFIFQNSLQTIKNLIKFKAKKNFSLKTIFSLLQLRYAAPKKEKFKHNDWEEIKISDLPLIQSYPKDGGAFITLPQVLSCNTNHSIKESNLGMYRIQLNGNDYKLNKEVGLHYQIHRGIGIHHKEHLKENKEFYVSIFIGGHPSHTLAAVMPLPENMSEISFAGILAKKRFKYSTYNNYFISQDCDFCIIGKVKKENMPEGPFGDHLGYYSLAHLFPALEVKKVFAKQNAIWLFTTVGRPPQEDTSFGSFIHNITADLIPSEINGVKEVNAVDEAGVHPLLLAIGSERYAPFYQLTQAQELLTQANAILGKGQLSLAKYLFIANKYDDPNLKTKNIKKFFHHILERVNWENDLHFQTKTTIDTLDYSSKELNFGSKVIIACVGEAKRRLSKEIPDKALLPKQVLKAKLITQGILALEISKWDKKSPQEIDELCNELDKIKNLENDFPLIVLDTNIDFLCKTFSNFLWVCFTRSNPAEDIYGIQSSVIDKHWQCKKSLIIDIRTKPHHAPPLIVPKSVTVQAKKILSSYLDKDTTVKGKDYKNN